MPDKIPCPACGTDNPLNALQCQVCDYDLAAALPAAPAASRQASKCPRCGSQVSGGAAFCPVCGQSMNERHPRPPTGALNVRKLFGELGDAPQPRGHLRERTEMAPSAAAYGNPMAPQHGAPSPQQPASRESSEPTREGGGLLLVPSRNIPGSFLPKRVRAFSLRDRPLSSFCQSTPFMRWTSSRFLEKCSGPF